MKELFCGNKVVVTGGSGGIGLAVAEQFSKMGAEVILIARNKNKLNDAVKKISTSTKNAHGYVCDVSSSFEIEEVCKKITTDIGVPDILVNNVGGFTQRIKWNDITSELWNNAIQTNLLSVYYCTKCFANYMIQQKLKGSIINIGSSSGLQPKTGRIHYTVTKAGVHTLTRVLALELAQYGIRVNAVAPGPTKTEKIQARFDDPDLAKIEMERIQKIPLKRFASVEEIADAVCFLASERASFITGVVLPVDGGYTIGSN